MRAETRVAKEVLQLSMAAAPSLAPAAGEEDQVRSTPHQGLSTREEWSGEHADGFLGDDDGSRSLRSVGSVASSISFSGGFDLSSALESTQVLLWT